MITQNKLPFLCYRWQFLRQKSGNMMPEFASRWNLPMYRATSSTWSFSLGSKLLPPTARAMKATLKVTTRSNLLHILTVSTEQFHFFKNLLEPRIEDKKTPGIVPVLPTAKSLGKGKDNETITAMAAAKDPMPAVGRGLQLSLSHEQKFLPGPLVLLPKLSEGWSYQRGWRMSMSFPPAPFWMCVLDSMFFHFRSTFEKNDISISFLYLYLILYLTSPRLF